MLGIIYWGLRCKMVKKSRDVAGAGWLEDADGAIVMDDEK